MDSDSVSTGPGDVVAGRYRVDARIGQGGCGVVFRATQLPLGRPVALKMLLVEALAQGDGEGRARFRREAELAQRLQHPNTVRLYDFGETEAGLPFIAWELLEGRPLDAVIAASGGLAPARVARVAAQTLKALMEAHALGIVHRDVKPSNIFLCEFPGEPSFVKVLDFGIAKSTLAHATALTREGAVVGTPAYMAPEQVGGGEITPATDLYALGLMMAEMLTGSPVFAGDEPLAILMAQLAEGPVPLPPAVLASPLGPVIARATEKQPALRFSSAQEMLQHLEAAAASLAPEPPAAPAATPSAATLATAPTAPAMMAPAAYAITAVAPRPAAEPPARRSRRPLLLVAALGGAVAVAAAAGLLIARRATVAAAPPRLDVKPTATPVGAAPGKRFAQLTNKQIRARIEQRGHKVTEERAGDPVTTWTLAGINRYVAVVRLPEPANPEAVERTYMKQGGATARDGNCVLHVELHDPTNARELLDEITR